MLVCAYGHACAECMYLCVETKAQSNLSLCGMLPTFFFFEIWFLIGMEVTRGQLDWLASGPPRIHMSPPPCQWDSKCAWSCLSFWCDTSLEGQEKTWLTHVGVQPMTINSSHLWPLGVNVQMFTCVQTCDSVCFGDKHFDLVLNLILSPIPITKVLCDKQASWFVMQFQKASTLTL